MKILCITNHLNTGGITSYALTLYGGLKRRGHEVYIASSGGEVLPKFVAAGIAYIHIPIKTKKEISLKIIFSAFKLAGIIKKNKIDIVHSHSRTTQVLGCLLERLTGARHIFTCHGFFKRRLLRKIFPCWPKKVIAISQQVKEHLIDDFKLDAKKISVIHNGIDLDRFSKPLVASRESLRMNLGLQDGPVIGIIARLSDVKGHKYLIEAIKNVLEEYPSANLLIVGEGKMQKELTAQVADLGISKNVFFVPEIADTVEALSAMDIFVMPSLQEGLGLALMEAMARGLAVIGSNIGGIKTLIQDGRTGLLVEPANADMLAQAILTLLADPSKRAEFGDEARNFIQNNFSQEKMVSETEKEYLLEVQ